VFVAAVVCLVAGLVLPSPADAARNGVLQVALPGGPFTSAPAGPLLDVDSLVPGGSTSQVLGVRSASTGAGELELRFLAVHDDDNGCTSPEAVVDTSCGTGGGELGTALRFALAVADAPDGTYVRTWSGTAAQLERGIDAHTVVTRGADRWVRLSATLPGSTGDEVQSDTFGFRLRVELAASQAFEAVTIGPAGSGGSTSGGGPLALTGTAGVLLLAGAVLLLLAGGMVLWAAAAGRRRD
jgi:hypothetical protein